MRGQGRLRRLLPLVVTVVAVGAAPAHAAEVTQVPASLGGFVVDSTDVRVQAPPGEVNRIAASLDGSTVVVHATTGPLTAGAGCTSADAATVRCAPLAPGEEPESFDADLGDGNDVLRAALPGMAVIDAIGGSGDDLLDVSASPGLSGTDFEPGAFLDGGPGSDRIVDGPASDVLNGGPGPDVLEGNGGGDELGGGTGADLLLGGAGNDELTGDGAWLDNSNTNRTRHPGSDRLDGGPGEDELDTNEQTAPVRIDLQRGFLRTRRGERDRLRSIEDVSGVVDGHDVITGSARANTLAGGGRLAGGAGNDVLEPERSGTRVAGGAGNDALTAQNGVRASFRCGPGRDRVRFDGPVLFVARDCEHIQTPFVGLLRLRVSGGRLRFGVDRRDVPSVLELRAPGGAMWARVRFNRPGRRHRRWAVGLTRAGRRAAERHRVAVVRLLEPGEHERLTWRTRL